VFDEGAVSSVTHDVLTASWNTLADEAKWPANGFYEREASGDINLKEYAQESMRFVKS
tara:strand:- start:91 stop:264 length:174 start_codon:yes stop_codon:yes gene_type:complete